MNIQTKTAEFSKLWLVVAGLFLSLTCTAVQETPPRNSAAVDQLLPEVESEATALERDSDAIAAWTSEKQVRWQSLVEELQLIREHVNLASRLARVLQAEREAASPRQQRAIDHICPLLMDLADNTKETLNHFSDNRCRTHVSAQRDYAKAGAKLARELRALISVYVSSDEQESQFDHSRKSSTEGRVDGFRPTRHEDHGKAAEFALFKEYRPDNGLKLSRDKIC